MNKESREVIRRAKKLAQTSKLCHLATTIGRQPQVRPMAFVWKKNNEIWFSTARDSRKVKQLKKNPNAEVYIIDREGHHCKIDGKCIVSDKSADKKALWKLQPELAKYFEGPNDSAFAVIKFCPARYEYMPFGDHAYQVAETSKK